MASKLYENIKKSKDLGVPTTIKLLNVCRKSNITHEEIEIATLTIEESNYCEYQTLEIIQGLIEVNGNDLERIRISIAFRSWYEVNE